MAKAEYRSAIRSRKLINEALAELLQEKPLEKITVTDVENRAQINRGTFYAHYADIPAVINRTVEHMFCRIRDALAQQQYPLEELPGVLLNQIQRMLEDEDIFFGRVANSHVARQMGQQLCRILLEYLLAHEQEYGLSSYEDYELKIRFCVGGLSQLYQDWFAGELHCTMEEFNQKMERIVVSTMH